MARSFLSFTFALATATLILLGDGATSVLAQPVTPVAPTAAAPKQKQYPEVQEALQLLAQRKMADAIKKLDEVSRKYPELPSAHVMMYLILAQNNQPNVARFELEVAIHANPSDPEPWVILGNIAMQERRVAEATNDFNKAQELLAAYTNTERKGTLEQQALSGKAQVAEANEDWKVAEARLKELLAKAPEDLAAHQRLARSMFWQGNAKEAYEILKKAKEIDRANAKKPGGKEAFLTPEAIMAQYYDQFEGAKSNTGNAEKWYKAALTRAPDDLSTRQVVAIWALEKGKLDFAKEQAEAALRIEAADAALDATKRKYKGSNVGRILRGLVALWEKKWDDGENYFQKVILEDPNNFVARNNMALALVEQEDPAKKQRALAYAEANYKDNKNNPDALSTLGWVYFRRGEFDQAGLAIEQAVKATGGNLNNPDTVTYLAHILHHRGEQDWQAKELLKTILDSGRPFSMKPEAEKLYEKVKDAKKPESATPTAPKTP
jgi:tetratricopeptide (TPR) repeat protein